MLRTQSNLKSSSEFETERQLLLEDIKADDLITQGRKRKTKRHRLNLPKEEIYPMVKMRGKVKVLACYIVTF